MSQPAPAEMIDRAMGALIGGAIGDALGMPTQLLSPARIAELYGHVEDFVAPVADHPVSKGLAAGTITDDTEQALLLGRILVELRRPLRSCSLGQRAARLGARRQGARQLRLARPIDQARHRRHQRRRAGRGSGKQRRHQWRGHAHRAGRHHDAAGAARRAGRQGGGDLPGDAQHLDRDCLGRRCCRRRQPWRCRRRLARRFGPGRRWRRGAALRFGHWIDRRRHRCAHRLGEGACARQVRHRTRSG